MSRLFHRMLLWGDFLEILSFLSIDDVYRCCGRLNRSGFIAFLRERATRQCPKESANRSRFLSRGLNHQKVLLVSYPRSGNSFLRRLLESSLGIVTGSDSRPNRTLSESLLRCGFKGEGVVDDSVWMVKTHYPERMGYLKFKVRRIVLLIRNPFDAIESYFHMGMTNTHDKHLSNQGFKSVAHLWPLFVANEIAVWVRFHEFWMAVSQYLPILPLRYEDLLSYEQESLYRIFDFAMDGPSPLGLNRFSPNYFKSDVVKSKSRSMGGPGYKPKAGGIGKGLRLLDDDIVDSIIEKCGKLLELFGYKVSASTKETDKKHNDDLVGHSHVPSASMGEGEDQYRMVGNDSLPINPSNENENAKIDMKVSGLNVLSNSESVRAKKPKITQKCRELHLLPFPVRSTEEWANEFEVALGICNQDTRQNVIYDAHKVSSCIPTNKHELISSLNETNSRKDRQEDIDSDTVAEEKQNKYLVGLGPDPGSDSVNSIMVNEQFSIRLPDDLYGRRLTEIRRLYTDDDIAPLNTE